MTKTKHKILIVEDEPIIASDIEMILEDLGYEITGIEDNAEDAINRIFENKPDLILLDINLEGDTDGIMLAQDINNKFKIPFIFLTSNADTQTINRVKRTKPAGFILKPFSEKDLQSNIEIVLFSAKENSMIDSEMQEDFFIKSARGLVKVKIKDIMLIQADDNYSKIVTISRNHLVSSTLKKLEKNITSPDFVRIHRSYIINMNYIDKIKDGYLHIKEHRLPIGRSYQEAFFQRINRL